MFQFFFFDLVSVTCHFNLAQKAREYRNESDVLGIPFFQRLPSQVDNEPHRQADFLLLEFEQQRRKSLKISSLMITQSLIIARGRLTVSSGLVNQGHLFLTFARPQQTVTAENKTYHQLERSYTYLYSYGASRLYSPHYQQLLGLRMGHWRISNPSRSCLSICSYETTSPHQKSGARVQAGQSLEKNSSNEPKGIDPCRVPNSPMDASILSYWSTVISLLYALMKWWSQLFGFH